MRITPLLICVLCSSVSLVVFAKTSKDPLILFEKGQAAFKDKKYQKAESYFREAYRIEENSKSLFYIAASKDKMSNDGENCTERLLAWERYMDICGGRAGYCDSAWVKSANKQYSGVKNGCRTITKNQAEPSKNSTKDASTTVMEMDTSFFCQLQLEPGVFRDLESCNGATLKENDRVKFSVTPRTSGYFYLVLYNESGQAQLVYPSSLDRNYLSEGKRYSFPNPDNNDGVPWFAVDEVKGVTEVLSLILSKQKIPELEAAQAGVVPMQVAKRFDRVDFKAERKMIEDKGNQGMSERLKGLADTVVSQYRFRHE